MESMAIAAGKTVQLNEWYDCTEEEYIKLSREKTGKDTVQTFVDEDDEEESNFADVIDAEVTHSDADTKEAKTALDQDEGKSNIDEELRVSVEAEALIQIEAIKEMNQRSILSERLRMDRKMKQIKSKSQTEGSASLHLTEPAEQGTGTSKLVEAAVAEELKQRSLLAARLKMESVWKDRMEEVREIYYQWCNVYGKNPEDSRFEIFKNNFISMERIANKRGETMKLNKWYDCTEEEYKQSLEAKAENKTEIQTTVAAEAETVKITEEEAVAVVEAQTEAMVEEDRIAAQNEVKLRSLRAEKNQRSLLEATAQNKLKLRSLRAEKNQRSLLEATNNNELKLRSLRVEQNQRSLLEARLKMETVQREKRKEIEMRAKSLEETMALQAAEELRFAEVAKFDRKKKDSLKERNQRSLLTARLQMEKRRLERIAHVRDLYFQWCTVYDKQADDVRFEIFKTNFLEMQSLAEKRGEPVKLNKWYDCTEEEYKLYLEARAEEKTEKETAVVAESQSTIKIEEEAMKIVETQAEALARAEEDERIAAEVEAQAKREEAARIAAEIEVKTKAEEDARIAADALARARAEIEANIAADALARAKAEVEATAAAETKAREKAEEDARIAAEILARAKAAKEERLNDLEVTKQRSILTARLELEAKKIEQLNKAGIKASLPLHLLRLMKTKGTGQEQEKITEQKQTTFRDVELPNIEAEPEIHQHYSDETLTDNVAKTGGSKSYLDSLSSGNFGWSEVYLDQQSFGAYHENFSSWSVAQGRAHTYLEKLSGSAPPLQSFGRTSPPVPKTLPVRPEIPIKNLNSDDILFVVEDKSFSLSDAEISAIEKAVEAEVEFSVMKAKSEASARRSVIGQTEVKAIEDSMAAQAEAATKRTKYEGAVEFSAELKAEKETEEQIDGYKQRSYLDQFDFPSYPIPMSSIPGPSAKGKTTSAPFSTSSRVKTVTTTLSYTVDGSVQHEMEQSAEDEVENRFGVGGPIRAYYEKMAQMKAEEELRRNQGEAGSNDQ